ncbi:PQQ-dependent sugar dehydrogenase, partial [Alphaproteobacteria bacterium]|nr:PQQ-dependent sugar dehydrogenase [Alphaproteobacteria bacterium]
EVMSLTLRRHANAEFFYDMKKNIILILLFCILTVSLIFSWNSIATQSEILYQKIFKYHMSTEFKILLKKTLFVIPVLKKSIKSHKKTIDSYETKINELIGHININPILSKKIKSKSRTYLIQSYKLPFPDQGSWGGKPLGYIDQTKENIIFVTGNGNFFSIEKKLTKLNKIPFKNIATNIKNIIKDESFYSPSSFSIKDLLILNNSIFISYTKELSEDCYNASILVANLDINFLNFREFFSHTKCKKVASAWMTGGRMIPFKKNKILFSVGTFTHNSLAQDKNSLFGKIISIDLNSGDYALISMGHRNPQGLYYSQDKDIIISTEHGPNGGDEININSNFSNNIIENYGWPISSYGEPDKGGAMPLHKSHKDHGFIEPIKYYTPSIAISEIIKIPESFFQDFINDFFVTALGYEGRINEGQMSIHHLRFNENYDQVYLEDIIPIGERIRDILFINETNQILLVLENTPSLAFLDIIN